MDNASFPGEAEAWMEEIASLLLSGQKLQAIKVYREVTGASLSDAKVALERLEQAIRYGALSADASSGGGLSNGNAGFGLPEMLLAEIGQLLARGQKIQAIKLYREHTGLNLADAKGAIERIDLMIRGGF